MNRTKTQAKGVLALALTLAAVAAPGARAADGDAGQWPTMAELQQFRFTPDGPGESSFPTMAELQQFRFTPGDTLGLPTLTHPFSFDGPSSQPGTPTVVTVTATPNLPSVSELEKFRFAPESQAPPVTAPAASDGIDWPDVGVGAGMGIGAALLAIAAAVGLRRHQRIAHS